MTHFTTFRVFLLFFLAFGQIQAQYASFNYIVEGEQITMADRLESAKVQGMAVAIIRNYEIDTILNVGMADSKNQVPVQVDTRFQAGSLTTPMTAILTVKAAQDGLIDLDTDINQYLKQWKLPNKKSSSKDPVTVKDLLTKRRGFTLYSKPSGYVSGSEIPNLVQVLDGETPAQNKAVHLRSKTHNQDNYSWETEAILTLLLEDVYGMDFANLVRTHIFEPLGLDQALLTAELNETQKEMASVGYDQLGIEIEGRRRIYPELGCAGLWISAEDYATFMIDIMKSVHNNEGKILSQKWAKEAVKAHHNGKSLLCNWSDKMQSFVYGGASKGFRTQMSGNPENGTGIVVFMNSNENWRFMNETQWGMMDHYELR